MNTKRILKRLLNESSSDNESLSNDTVKELTLMDGTKVYLYDFTLKSKLSNDTYHRFDYSDGKYIYQIYLSSEGVNARPERTIEENFKFYKNVEILPKKDRIEK